MAENVVCFLLERLGGLVIHEAQFLNGVRDKVGQLQRELQRMRCFLRDADSRQGEDATVRQWVAEIRDLSYDADDIIDTFDLKIESRSKLHGISNFFIRFSKCGKTVKTLYEVGSKIGKINSHISELTGHMDSYGIKRLEEGEGPSSSYKVVKRKLRHTYSHVVDRNVVGLEEDANILVAQLLKEGNYSRRVVSICGMGGLGKTTLARKVYHHEEVREYFHSFVWVCVSQQWQTRDIWEQILFKVIDVDEEKRKESSKKKDNEIAKELFEVLKNKRCLLVLDDMWDGDAWSLLSAGFPPHEDTQTKILLTSRNKDVAFRADPRGFLYEPSCLNDEESWELFQKIAVFGRVLDDAGSSEIRCFTQVLDLYFDDILIFFILA